MYGKDQWRGREVEGRYSDMMTYFVRDLDESKKESYGLDIINLKNYPHYYFTIEYMKKSMKDETYFSPSVLLNKDILYIIFIYKKNLF